MSESRREVRLPCSFPAALEGPRGALRGFCKNISIGGLFFEGHELPLGKMVNVTVDLGARGRLKSLAQVRHHSVTPKGMGLQFTRLDPADVDTLQRLIAQLTR